MNANLTQREWLAQTARGNARPTGGTGEPLVQTFEGTKERLARQILAASGPMRRPDRHRHWLLSLEVEVLKDRLQILVTQR